MGLFDIFAEIVPELKDLGNEIQGIKDDLISSVMEPSTEFRDTVNGIASDLTGQSESGAAIDASTLSSEASASPKTSIPISDGNE